MVNIKESLLWLGSLGISTVFEYDTPKYVHIKNKKIGLLNRLIQLAIVAYVIG
jgi:P2X purinoceptor 4